MERLAARSSVLRAAAAFVALWGVLHAQVAWTRPPLIENRSSHAIAFDSARGRVVLFGGTSGFELQPDTWEWDGAAWLRRTPPIAPAPRSSAAMVHDRARAR